MNDSPETSLEQFSEVCLFSMGSHPIAALRKHEEMFKDTLVFSKFQVIKILQVGNG